MRISSDGLPTVVMDYRKSKCYTAYGRIGHSNITDDYANESIAQITASGKTSIMTPEFQCNIIRCAAELARFSPMTLFAYIKKYMHIGGV